ncbi:Acyl-[acyl-carrier-protein]--UDP-N-acetylglucosamine O-acyltransferase [Andreprevotia sp. IGB-42]|uniref:acyl-ACP--UDP-N-acetylglucosamine O-acyltransferase n=1 Tax=Andreprevotia sp. IGB-42 TaxID=2497473 RepID=UPI001359DB41|nr:acyl-ACP--UDP-N-acetylglucosamine O-acyltransferase [Andreprevotia sp. IGB-42]KAF0814370.1 Acyl-[acyl-carrier-protein]--UDP-N-acetylglucosamine O-acyltransferase [Andreprevotia sp. IGB-42]
MTLIHPSAIVDSRAELAPDVQVGPFSVIGPGVRIGAGTVVGPHVVIDGETTIGTNNRFHPFAHIGCQPQDKKYAGEPTGLVIGDGNTFFQSVTLSTGTAQDEGITRVGNDNWVMAYVHIAHDCQIGSHCIFANNATLAGHVHIGDWVFLGGFTTIHQFCKVGSHAMSAFTAAISQDVPPYVTAAGNRAVPAGINSEGLRRRGFSGEQITVIKRAYKTLYRQNLPFDDARAQIEAAAQDAPELQAFVDFFATSTRGLIR